MRRFWGHTVATERFRNLSSVAREASGELGQTIGANEVRFVCMYENVTVYMDPKSRARYVDGRGYATILRGLKVYMEGRREYYQMKTHPDYTGEKS
jgi:hypothetical protein